MAPRFMVKSLYMVAYQRHNAFFVGLKCTCLYGGLCHMAAKALGQTPAI